jgi:hypothetical protein
MSNKKNEGLWVSKARKPLSTWEVLQGWRAAIFKVPFATYENNIKSRMLDRVDPLPSVLVGGKSRRSAERKLLKKGYVETETKIARLNSRLVSAQVARDEACARFAKKSFPPVDGKAAFAMSALAGGLLVADGGFTYSAVADLFGADLSHGLDGASTVTLLCAAGGTFVLLAVNAFSGSAATASDPPVRRLLGGLGLLGVGATVGVIRGSAVANPSIFLAVVNTVLSVASGALAGVAHHWIADYLKRKSEAAEVVRAARQPVDDAERGVVETELQLREAIADRKRLALALDAMDSEPVRQATDDGELRRFQDARLAAAKFVYESAARFVGRRLGEEK